MPVKFLTFFFLLQLWGAGVSHALNIQLDFTYDNANGGFFNSNSTARLAVEAAARDLSSAIQPSLAALQRDIYTGTSGQTTGDDRLEPELP
jgi:hypothetical protein